MTSISFDALLREQEAVQFADLAGAQASLELPISDRLINQLIAGQLPASAPVRELRVDAEAGNRITLHVRLRRPAFLPAFRIGLFIDRQPDLPASPIVVLRLASEHLAALAGKASRFIEFLPPGVSLAGELVIVNLETILRRYETGEALRYLTHLELTTDRGRVIITARAVLPPRS